MSYIRSSSGILIVFILILSISCNRNTIETENTSNSGDLFSINLEHFKAEDTVYMSDIFKKPKYLQLQNPYPIVIGEINEIIFWDDYIYVLDQMIGKQVFKFKKDGSFDCFVGSVGKGPGEYQRPDDISLDIANGHLLVYSRQERKICYYDLNNANFLFEKILNFAAHEIQPLDDMNYAVFNHDIHNLNSELLDNDYNLTIYNNTFSQIKYRHSPFLFMDGMGKPVITTGRYFNENNSEILLNWRFNDTIYSVTNEGAIPIIVFEFGDRKVKANTYEETNAVYVLKEIEAGRFASIWSNVLIADSILFTRFRSPLPSGNANKSELFYLIKNLKQDSEPVICRNIVDDYYRFPFNFPTVSDNKSFISILYPDKIVGNSKNSSIVQIEKETGLLINDSYNPILLIYNPIQP